MAGAGMATEPDTQFSLLSNCLQCCLEASYVGGIPIRISVRVLVKENEGVLSIQRINIFQPGRVRIKQSDSGIRQQRFESSLLEHCQRHGWLVVKYGMILLIE